MNAGKLVRVHEVPQVETQIISVRSPSEKHAKIREWERQAVEDAPVIVPVKAPEKVGSE